MKNQTVKKAEIVEIYQYLDQYFIVRGYIMDEVGKIHPFEFCFNHYPKQEEIDGEIEKIETQITKLLEFEKNPLNSMKDKEFVMSDLEKIKQEIVSLIREEKSIDEEHLVYNISFLFPGTLLVIKETLNWYIKESGKKTFDDFKVFTLNEKFVGVD